jgi:hypothetical protein
MRREEDKRIGKIRGRAQRPAPTSAFTGHWRLLYAAGVNK